MRKGRKGFKLLKGNTKLHIHPLHGFYCLFLCLRFLWKLDILPSLNLLTKTGTELDKGCEKQQVWIELQYLEKKVQGEFTTFEKLEGRNGNNRHGEGWGTQQVLCLRLTVCQASHTYQVPELLCRSWGSKVPPTVNKVQVWDQLMRLNAYRNWQMWFPSHSKPYTKKWRLSREVPGSGKRETSLLFIKKVERKKDPETTGWWASSLCLERSWNESSWKLC